MCSLSSPTPPLLLPPLLLPPLNPPSTLPTYREEIAYLMECADTNKDGLLDYKEFTERFHQPAESIGFHLCVLIVHLSDHLPQDRRLEQFKCSPQGRELMEHFQHNMGCIEILGKSKRIERVYFEVKESWLQQWEEAQIQESKRNFLHSVEMGSQKKKLEGFVSFCEDTIFEVSADSKPRTPLAWPYAVIHDSIMIQYGCSKCFLTFPLCLLQMDYMDSISGAENVELEMRAKQHRHKHTKALQLLPQYVFM